MVCSDLKIYVLYLLVLGQCSFDYFSIQIHCLKDKSWMHLSVLDRIPER